MKKTPAKQKTSQQSKGNTPLPAVLDHSQATNPPKHLSRCEAQKLRNRFALNNARKPLIPLLPPEKAVDAMIDVLIDDQAISAVGKVAVELLEQGDVDAFFRAIERFGPAMLEVPEVMRVIKGWWFQEKPESEKLRRVGVALAYSGRGNVRRLTTEERGKNVKESNRVAQHNQRVNTALRHLQARFFDAEQRLREKGKGDPETLREAASLLLLEEGRIKQGKASVEARRKFKLQVDSHLGIPHFQPCPLCQK
jgi:hypothetical protein